MIIPANSIIFIFPESFDFADIKQKLEAAGFKADMAEVVMKPDSETLFEGDDAVKMQKLLDALENLDDVQEIYTNAVLEN